MTTYYQLYKLFLKGLQHNIWTNKEIQILLQLLKQPPPELLQNPQKQAIDYI